MPELKRNFASGRMNKDVDERLVPNGEYRGAMNVQVSTSDGGDVGTVQNILGNAQGCATTSWSLVGGPMSHVTKVVGGIADEKNDTLYWLTTTDNTSLQNIEEKTLDNTAAFPIRSTDMISSITKGHCSPVFVDQHSLIYPNVQTGVSAFVSPPPQYTESDILKGMTVIGFGFNPVTGVMETTSGIDQAPVVDESGVADTFTEFVTIVTQPVTPPLPTYSSTNGFLVEDGSGGITNELIIQTPGFGSSTLPVGFGVGDEIALTDAGGSAYLPAGTVITGITTIQLTPTTSGKLLSFSNAVVLPASFGAAFVPSSFISLFNAFSTPLTYTVTDSNATVPTGELQFLASSPYPAVIHQALSAGGEVQLSQNAAFPYGVPCVDPTSVTSSNDLTFKVVNCSTGVPMNISCLNQCSGSVNFQFTLVGSSAGAPAIILDKPIDLTGGPNSGIWDYLIFQAPKTLNFGEDKIITGLNIVDDMLFWVDGVGEDGSEPKKININRSIAGTDPSGLSHTRLINEGSGIGFPVGIDVPMEERYVTVIKQSPTNALTVGFAGGRDDDYTEQSPGGFPRNVTSAAKINLATDVISVNGNTSFNLNGSNGLKLGDKVRLNIKNDWENGFVFRLDWKIPGTTVVLQESSGGSFNIPLENYDIKATVTGWSNENFNYSSSYSDTLGTIIPVPPTVLTPVVELEITGINSTNISNSYIIDKFSDNASIFEFKFPRFAYRYRYEDGEYSTFSPFTEVVFLPGGFDYHPKKGYNKGMVNRIKEIELSNFVSADMPADVVSIDILYKEDSSPNVYVVDTLSPKDSIVNNPWEANTLLITTEIIKAAVASNQSLRGWDNVPRKAASQEVVGNRLVYGNYLQNLDLTTEGSPDVYSASFNNSLVSFSESLVTKPAKSIKSLREYQVGIIFSDKYGRETPILTDASGKINIPKKSGGSSNRIRVGMNAAAYPEGVESFRVYIKENSGEYYNMGMDRWYEAGDGNIWLAFPSSDRNKVDIETFVILKKAAGGDILVDNESKYKVLAIENEAPLSVKTDRRLLGSVLGVDCSPLAAPVEGQKNFEFTMPAGNNATKMNELTGGDLYFNLTSASGDEESEFFLISNISIDDSSGADVYSVAISGSITEADFMGTITNPVPSTSINFYHFAEAASNEFEGKFFVKIYGDASLRHNIIDPSLITGATYTVIASKKIYRLKSTFLTDYEASGTADVSNITSSNSDASWVASNPQSSYASTFLRHPSSGLIPPGSAYGGTGNTVDKLEELWLQNAAFLMFDGASWGDLGNMPLGVDNPVRSWWKFAYYFHGGINTSFNTETSEGLWFIDELESAGKFQYSKGFKKGHTPTVAFGGIDSYKKIGNTHSPSGIDNSSGVAVIELGFGGINQGEDGFKKKKLPGQWLADDYTAWGGNHVNESRFVPFVNSDDGFFPFWERARYDSEEIFASRLRPGALLRWKEDPAGTIFTVDNISHHLLCRYDSTGYDVAPFNMSSNFSQNFRLTLNKPMDVSTYSPLTGMNGESPHVYKTALGATAENQYKTLQIIEKKYDHGAYPTNPAVWETEPKDLTTELGIYYEASGSIPTKLNKSTIKTLIPIGSRVSSSSITDTDIIAVGYSFASIIIDSPLDDDFLGVQSDPSNINAANQGVVVLPGDTLSITRPDESIITVTVTEVVEPNPSGYGFTISLSEDVSNIEVSLNWHNCFAFGNGVESNRIRDSFNLPFINTGVTASAISDEIYKEENRKAGMIYSGIYNSTSGVNNLNQFIQAEKITKDLNPSYGSIQKLHARDTDLIALCEDKILKILANKDALYNADGNPQLIATNNVLGQAIPFSGEFGISKNPESFASESYRVYFADKVRGAILRLSLDGLTPISNYGMKDWFRDNLKVGEKLIGSYDDRKDEYNITIITDTISENTTVSFREDAKGWVSFKSFVPEVGISMANDYYTFSKGNIWKHHVEGTLQNPNPRNTFYGVYANSSLNILFNDLPGTIKSFNTLSYEGTQSKVNVLVNDAGAAIDDGQYYNLANKDGWSVSTITTDKEEGSLSEFIEKEGKWFNYIKGRSVASNVDNTITLQSGLDVGSLAVQGIGILEQAPVVVSISGCTDSTMFNYDPLADFDDGSCVAIIFGCIDISADNWNPAANTSDGNCIWEGCTCGGNTSNGAGVVNNCYGDGIPAYNYNTQYNSPSTGTHVSCIPTIYGCTDPTMANYNPLANTDDGNCTTTTTGCTDPTAYNYSPSNNSENGSCTYLGCLDSLADNGFYEHNSPALALLNSQGISPTNICDGALPYDPNNLTPYPYAQTTPPCPTVLDPMNNPQSVCAYSGCDDNTACNFNPAATSNDNSCLYCSDSTANNYDGGACSTGCVYCPAAINVTLLSVSPPSLINQYGTIEVQWEVPAGTDMTIIDKFWIRTAPTASSPPFSTGFGTWITNFTNGTDFTAADGTGPFTASISYNLFANNDYNLTVDTICSNSSEMLSATTAQLTNITIPTMPIVYGCFDDGTDPTFSQRPASFVGPALNYDPLATFLDWQTFPFNSPVPPAVWWNGCCYLSGCTDPSASNYDATINVCETDNTQCTYAPVLGCTNPAMFNYDPLANTDDGSCTPFIYGCTFTCASNTNPYANTNETSAVDSTDPCVYTEGCTDPSADNFGYYVLGFLIASQPCSSSTTHTCDYYGCTDPTADNWDSTATTDDGSCTYPQGCNPGNCPSPPASGGIISGVSQNGFSWYSNNFSSCLFDHPGGAWLHWRQVTDANGPIAPLPNYTSQSFNPTVIDSANPVIVTGALSLGTYEYYIDAMCIGGGASTSSGSPGLFNCASYHGCS